MSTPADPGASVDPAAECSPALLVTDVMTLLLYRGFDPRLAGERVAVAHQAAWTLLTTVGVPVATDCPCLACNGVHHVLNGLELVADGDGLAELRGRSGGDAGPSPGPGPGPGDGDGATGGPDDRPERGRTDGDPQ